MSARLVLSVDHHASMWSGAMRKLFPNSAHLASSNVNQLQWKFSQISRPDASSAADMLRVRSAAAHPAGGPQ